MKIVVSEFSRIKMLANCFCFSGVWSGWSTYANRPLVLKYQDETNIRQMVIFKHISATHKNGWMMKCVRLTGCILYRLYEFIDVREDIKHHISNDYLIKRSCAHNRCQMYQRMHRIMTSWPRIAFVILSLMYGNSPYSDITLIPHIIQASSWCQKKLSTSFTVPYSNECGYFDLVCGRCLVRCEIMVL